MENLDKGDLMHLAHDGVLMVDVTAAVLGDADLADDLAEEIADQLSDAVEDDPVLKNQLIVAAIENPEFWEGLVRKVTRELDS